MAARVTWKVQFPHMRGAGLAAYVTGVPETVTADVIEDMARAMLLPRMRISAYMSSRKWPKAVALALGDSSPLDESLPAFSFCSLLLTHVPVDYQPFLPRIDPRIAFAILRLARAKDLAVRDWVGLVLLRELEREGYSPADVIQCVLQGVGA